MGGGGGMEVHTGRVRGERRGGGGGSRGIKLQNSRGGFSQDVIK